MTDEHHPHDNPLYDKFESLVADAIDNIPQKYQKKMKSVAIVVADVPTPEQRRSVGLRKHGALYGLYQGVPLPQRGGATLTIQPDIITIFRYPMLHFFKDESSLRKQIYKTLWHEVAHYFGLNHDQIHEAEKK